MNGPEGFDIKDGIFRVEVTGLYMFTVHALPMAEQPFMVQIHHNGQSVAAFSNGIKGIYIFFLIVYAKGFFVVFSFGILVNETFLKVSKFQKQFFFVLI